MSPDQWKTGQGGAHFCSCSFTAPTPSETLLLCAGSEFTAWNGRFLFLVTDIIQDLTDIGQGESPCTVLSLTLRKVWWPHSLESLHWVLMTKTTPCFSIHSRLPVRLSENFCICVFLGPAHFSLSVLLLFIEVPPLPKINAKFLSVLRNILHYLTPTYLSSLLSHSSWWPCYVLFTLNYTKTLFYFLALCFYRHFPLCLGYSFSYLLLKPRDRSNREICF